MDSNEAIKNFISEFLIPNKEVYGVSFYKCNNCEGDYIGVSMNTDNKELMEKIPNLYLGYKVRKIMSGQSKPLKKDLEAIRDEFSKVYGSNKGVFAITTNKENNTLTVHMNTKDLTLNTLIPKVFQGIQVLREYGSLSLEYNPILAITPKGQKALRVVTMMRGYIPDSLYVLLLLESGKADNLNKLKQAKRKLQNTQATLDYLQSKGLITIK